MKSGTWNERTLSPELYEMAREAAQRAGVPVEDWLRSTFGDSAVAALPQHSAGQTSARSASLVDTAVRLNERLDRLSAAHSIAINPATADPSPALTPRRFSLEKAVAEISARQRALESPTAPAASPPVAPDISGLERQLQEITSQLQAIQPPRGIDTALSGLRDDLGSLARSIHDVIPGRTLENLQNDLHLLTERMSAQQPANDQSVLEAIEHNLSEFNERLDGVAPKSQLAALDARLSELSHKVDGLGSSPDPETLRHLEAAVHELRELSSGAASAEGVASLAGDIQSLATRIDRIADRSDPPRIDTAGIDTLSQRVTDLTHLLEARVTVPVGPPSNLENLIATLSEKLDHVDALAHEHTAFDHLGRQIATISDKMDAADQRFAGLSAIERAMQELNAQTRQAGEQAAAAAERAAHQAGEQAAAAAERAALQAGELAAAAADRAARQVAADIPHSGAEVIALKRDLESMHVNQVESEHRTHETLEAVHDTLERLVERLAAVETHRVEAPIVPEPSLPALRPAQFAPTQRTERPPIDPDLPADTPIEPGSAGRARTPSPAERIAASEAALAPLNPEPAPEVTGKANFIAAARRAAQAAANEGTPVEGPRAEERKEDETPTSLIGRFLSNRRRALMLGVSALLILYGGIQVAGMFRGEQGMRQPAETSSQASPAQAQKIAEAATPPAPAQSTSAAAAPAGPAIVSLPVTQTEPSSQSSAAPLLAPKPTAIAPAPMSVPTGDVTGSVSPQADIPALAAKLATPQAAEPLADKLPAAIGGPVLREAAAAGDAAAEFEIGVRYSEGRGVPANLELAVQWFDRAAKQGLAPALYRLGSLYEKGQGTKKDLEKARELYLLGTEKGNPKATHNLAVLYAEGIDGKPDYKTASQWFRKAADHGVADSQYNLGILFARGIGVEQNLAESYKWFALAANQGDKDAAKKRDDVAARLDQQSLVAAKLAVQTWTADLPADEAMNVKAPAGGWDRTTASAAPKPAKANKPTTLRQKALSPS